MRRNKEYPYGQPFARVRRFPDVDQKTKPGETVRVVHSWVYDLAREWKFSIARPASLATEAYPEDAVFEFLATVAGEAGLDIGLSVRMNSWLARALKTAKLPVDAIGQVLRAVDWYRENVSRIETPSCLKLPGSVGETLWKAIHIYGCGGEPFMFANNAIAKAVGGHLKSRSVGHFLDVACERNIIEVVEQGGSYACDDVDRRGKATQYRIIDPRYANNLFRVEALGKIIEPLEIKWREYAYNNLMWIPGVAKELQNYERYRQSGMTGRALG